MKLGVLGSDKLVTTTNAVMYEVFAGVRPSEIVIFSEDPPSNEFTHLSNALSILGLNPKIRFAVLGDNFASWQDVFRKEDVDVLDVTPGRKITALVAASNSRGKTRYAYLKEEVRGYRVFGHVPLSNIKLVELGGFAEVPMRAQPTLVKGMEEVVLDVEGITATYNLLTLAGRVSIRFGSIPYPATLDELLGRQVTLGDDEAEYIKTCFKRAGYLRYDEENLITQSPSILTFDTNVYIEVGERVGLARKTYPLRVVYDELDRLSLNYTRNPSTKEAKFLLGMATYTRVHGAPSPSLAKHSGDAGIIEETMERKKHLESLTLVTLDAALAQRAAARGINVIHPHTLRKGVGDPGEFLRSAVQYSDVEIYLQEKLVAQLKREDVNHIRFRTLKDEYNYAELIYHLKNR
ncbi:MAG: hypothetical protein QW514_10115 [Thermoprotei archaeon]